MDALSPALRQHAGYADRHGWGASLEPRAGHPSPVRRRPPPHGPHRRADGPDTRPGIDAHRVRIGHDNEPPRPRPSPLPPPLVVQDPHSVAIGGTLDVTLPNLGLGGTGVTYTITPQPLPANMTFNRGTGELAFAPAPGQAGTFNFSVAVSNGSRSGTIVLPVTVTDPAVPSTEVSGQVVDENGNPLAGMPVTIGTASAVTNPAGDFTLTGIPANPGPISAGGSVASAQGRLAI